VRRERCDQTRDAGADDDDVGTQLPCGVATAG
jgi:hypothetical protein